MKVKVDPLGRNIAVCRQCGETWLQEEIVFAVQDTEEARESGRLFERSLKDEMA